jgi:uracil-DNA glycosylase
LRLLVYEWEYADMMPDGDSRAELTRQVRQRLESLRRAGIDRVALEPPDASDWVRREPAAEAKPAAAREESTLRPPPTVDVAHPPAPGLRTPALLFDDPGLDEAVVLAQDRPALLSALAAEVAVCQRCPVLASSRSQTVFGVGSPTARLMFVGEAPGAEEDRTGVPFVGRAGSLLTDMITKGMGLTREEVYIANVIKSRPPENRNPLPDEVGHCLPYLERQIAIIRPEFLCLLGRVAVSALLDTAMPLSRLRSRWHRYRAIPTIVTYHPAFLLRNPASKKEAWEDLQMLMQAMGITPPRRSKE